MGLGLVSPVAALIARLHVAAAAVAAPALALLHGLVTRLTVVAVALWLVFIEDALVLTREHRIATSEDRAAVS